MCNLGFSGISAKEYLAEIIDKGLIKTLGNDVIVMLGTNDLTRHGETNESICRAIQDLIANSKRFVRISIFTF
ncbi:N-acylneuraminate cytidylyltransferase [Actinobacillus equuli]|nr:N-acylneuraminate cytidylyltransferase [Actinobacillus equuli]